MSADQSWDANPFTPGFGEPPPYLAGRDDLINETLVGLRRGAGRSDYHRLVVGARGTGKTALMNAIVAVAESEHGAVVVRWTAGSRPLAEAITSAATPVHAQLRARWRRAGSAIDASATIGVPGVASATAKRRRQVDTVDGSFGQLERLARLAASRRRHVIVLVDEAQSATGDEARTLAGVMQELANVQDLPIAVYVAGLPDTRARWLDAASFLERHPFTTLGPLGADDTAAAIEIPIREHGRTIDDDALDLLVVESKGHPYAVQLMAAAAWTAAENANIDRDAARNGVDSGVGTLREQVFGARWRQLTEAQRRYAVAAAAVEDRSSGAISSAQVAAHLGATTKAVSRQRDDLIRVHQLLASDGRDHLTFTQPGMGDWLRLQHEGRRRAHDPTP
jgi:AAA ATPase domain